MTTIQQEIEFLDQHHQRPWDFEHLKQAHADGLISGTARGREIQELLRLLQHADSRPVWYDHTNKQWHLYPNNVCEPEGYGTNAASKVDWDKLIRKGDRTNPASTKKYHIIQRDGSTKEVDCIQTNLLYGLELEVLPDSTQNASRGGLVAETSNFFGSQAIITRDGSISAYNGFEVVTTPHDFSATRDVLQRFTDCPLSLKLDSNRHTGMHVHVSREPFNMAKAAKLMYFCHNSHNKEFFQSIGKRESYEYCKYLGTSLEREGINSPVDMLTKGGVSMCVQHYAAISVSERHPTFEFRIFQMHLDKQTLLGQYEFVAAVCQFILNGAGVNTYKYEDFLTWLQDPYGKRYREPNRSIKPVTKHPHYPYLYQMLIDDGWITLDKGEKLCA